MARRRYPLRPLDRKGRPLRPGDRVRLVTRPLMRNDPPETRAVFRQAVGRVFVITDFDRYGHAELDLSMIERWDSAWVDPRLLSLVSRGRILPSSRAVGRERRQSPAPRPYAPADFDAVLEIVNDAAQIYRGAIPEDCWHEPYMPAGELRKEIEDGVEFWVAEKDGRPIGAMGIQDRGEVALVRHAYVAPGAQRSGAGSALLRHIEGLAQKPILIGTWAASAWAIAFYRKHGYTLLPGKEKEILLRRYWSIPQRQVETSVVLADRRWMERN